MAQPTRMFPIPTTPQSVGTHIRKRRDFDYTSGMVVGRTRPPGFGNEPGLLPRTWFDQLTNLVDAPDLFVIFSMGTPIAWYAKGQWTVPDCVYDPRTHRHRETVRKAVAGV